jgi:hypothetical protein
VPSSIPHTSDSVYAISNMRTAHPPSTLPRAGIVTARVRGDVEMWHVVCRVIATNGDAEWRVTRVAHTHSSQH